MPILAAIESVFTTLQNIFRPKDNCSLAYERLFLGQETIVHRPKNIRKRAFSYCSLVAAKFPFAAQ